jgi:Zn-dependent protease with chaperone function
VLEIEFPKRKNMNNMTTADMYEFHRMLVNKRDATKIALESLQGMCAKFGDNEDAVQLRSVWRDEVIQLTNMIRKLLRMVQHETPSLNLVSTHPSIASRIAPIESMLIRD